MIVVMKKDYKEGELKTLLERIEALGLSGHISQGTERTVIGVVGKVTPDLKDNLELFPGVEDVIPISRPYKLSSREFQQENTVVKVRDITIGGGEVVIIAGPCAVESGMQVIDTAR